MNGKGGTSSLGAAVKIFPTTSANFNVTGTLSPKAQLLKFIFVKAKISLITVSNSSFPLQISIAIGFGTLNPGYVLKRSTYPEVHKYALLLETLKAVPLTIGLFPSSL